MNTMNNMITTPTTKISLELPTSLLAQTKVIASHNMCSLSAIVRQSLQEKVSSNSNKL